MCARPVRVSAWALWTGCQRCGATCSRVPVRADGGVVRATVRVGGGGGLSCASVRMHFCDRAARRYELIRVVLSVLGTAAGRASRVSPRCTWQHLSLARGALDGQQAGVRRRRHGRAVRLEVDVQANKDGRDLPPGPGALRLHIAHLSPCMPLNISLWSSFPPNPQLETPPDPTFMSCRSPPSLSPSLSLDPVRIGMSLHFVILSPLPSHEPFIVLGPKQFRRHLSPSLIQSSPPSFS